MALPTQLQHGLSPAEVTFLGESTLVFIQPRQAMSPLQLIDTTIPAFKPPQSVQVPLWLGLLLKRQRRARIIPPPWLNHDHLQDLLEQEEQPDSPFSSLPFQWLEISTALLEAASDDIVEPDLTRRLLRDLREVRQAKARKGIETIGDTHLQMDNLGLMEISEIRFLSKALDQLRQLNAVRGDVEGGGLGMESNGDMEDNTTWDE